MKISSHKLKNPIFISSSKSYAARMLLMGAVSENEISISDIPESQDSLELIEVLKKLGVGYWDSGRFVLDKSFPRDELPSKNPIVLNLGEGGTTIRFMLSLLSLGQNTYILKVHPRFKLRPFIDQLELLKSLGARIVQTDKEDELCSVQGPILFPRSLTIDCSKTTQVASSFLILAKFNNCEIKTQNLNSSTAYVEMTKNVLNSLKKEFSVPVDMSSASAFMVLASVFQDLEFPQILVVDPLQADSTLISILKSSGANIEFSPHLKIKRSLMSPFIVDGAQCLDLIPNLCFLASFIEGSSKIYNIENLKHKESNRIQGICQILDQVGVVYKLENNSIEIEGVHELKPIKKIHALADHRIVMLASLFLKVNGGGEVTNSKAVAKSNSNFFDLLN
jgi:3-phosphoshikimate 1-carboxyvinyltransferase